MQIDGREIMVMYQKLPAKFTDSGGTDVVYFGTTKIVLQTQL